MRGDSVLSQAFTEMMGHTLGETAGVYENESGAVLSGQCGNAVVNFVPHFVGRDGTELAARNFDGQIQFPPMADLHDDRIGVSSSTEKLRNKFDGPLRGGKTDAGQRFAGQMIETFEGKSQVRAALVVGHGVDFVDDDGANGFQDFAAFRGGQENVQRLGSSDQDMRRTREHRAALVGESVSGAHGGANVRHEEAALPGELKNFAERSFQILLNVVTQRLERRDIEDIGLVGQFPAEGFANEAIDADEKRGQSFA